MRYYVEPTGTGTSTNHWSLGMAGDLVTTVAAILAAPSSGGDEIWAKQGQYNLAGNPVVINQNPQPLSIYGGFDGTELTLCDRDANINSLQYPTFFQFPSILDGGGPCGNRVIDIQGANVCRIDGFIIQNGDAGTGNNGGGVYVSGAANTIWLENLVIMDNEAGNNGGGIASVTFNVMIKNSIFFRNRAINGGGFSTFDGGNAVLVNVLFNANETFRANGNGNAIYAVGSPNVKIINSTISGNTIGSSDVYINDSGVEIYNSIIYPDSLVAAVPPTPAPTVRVEYCCLPVLPTPPILTPNIPSLIIGNPNFMNMATLAMGGNYHLSNTAASQSSCIDAGNTGLIFSFSATDLEGNPRFINGGNPSPFPLEVDMGAFEVQ